MDSSNDETKERLRQLELENLRLKAELEARRAGQKAGEKTGKFLARVSTRLVAGSRLKKSIRRLLDELPGKPSKDTIADVTANVIFRITRIGLFALFIAAAPLLVMVVQTYILNRQNDKLEIQNQLLGRQNERLDQQINLEEGNRRSSLIFFMSNIMDRIDDEMRNNPRRNLSEPLIGRIVSLSQALRPYRYLENDSLTSRQLSPERGQLLFSLVNSDLERATYDKIFARANFSYADLQEANFTEAYMRGAKLANSYFYKANFRNADLENADLSNAYLEEATFRNTHMDGVDLKGANLRKSHMEGISLIGGNLAHADLREIYLDGDFGNTNLEGVKVQDAMLTNVNLEGCFFQSLSWLDSLDSANLKGLFSVRGFYEPFKEIVKKGFTSDTVYVLRPDPNSPSAKYMFCSKAVAKIVESASVVMETKRKSAEAGQELSLYPVSNPFGIEELGIKKDSVYLYRLSNNQADPSSTLMWVQFNPKQQKLLEIFPEAGKQPAQLEFNKKLLTNLSPECQQIR